MERLLQMGLTKLKNKIWLWLSPILFQIFIVLLTIVITVGVAEMIVDNIKSFFGDIGSGIFKKDAVTWVDNLSEEELEKFMEDGSSVHPYKLKMYIQAEESSIPRDVKTKRKVWKREYGSKTNQWLDTSGTPAYEEHTLDLSRAAYPYRLFMEAMLPLEQIKSVADNPADTEFLDLMTQTVSEGGLASEFDWSFDYTENKTNGLMNYNVDEDSFSYEKTHFVSYYSKTKTYRNGQYYETDENQVDYRYSFPLPYLNKVTTMFKDYTFEYERVTLDETNWEEVGLPTVREWETEEYSHSEPIYEYEIDEDGLPKIKTDEAGNPLITGYEDHYETIRWKSVTVNERKEKTEMDLPLPEAYSDNSNFLSFLTNNDIDIESDPALISEVAAQFPDSYHFLQLYQDVLVMNTEELDISWGGVDIEIGPTDSNWLNGIPYILQTDPRWKNIPYGREGTIGSSACGPTAMTVVIQSFLNSGVDLNIRPLDLDSDGLINPYEMVQYSLRKGHRVYGAGTSWAFFADVGNTVGLNVRQVARNQAGATAVLNALREGDLVISSMGPGVFTRGGHYIALVGIDSAGKIIVRDSNSIRRSQTTYNFSSPVFSQAKQFWIISD